MLEFQSCSPQTEAQFTASIFMLEFQSSTQQTETQFHNRRQAIPNILHGITFEEILISAVMSEYYSL